MRAAVHKHIFHSGDAAKIKPDRVAGALKSASPPSNVDVNSFGNALEAGDPCGQRKIGYMRGRLFLRCADAILMGQSDTDGGLSKSI